MAARYFIGRWARPAKEFLSLDKAVEFASKHGIDLLHLQIWYPTSQDYVALDKLFSRPLQITWKD